ncbi:MAG: DUF948 domain-containing protein [Eggerthellaceae bacterium]|nr:DUF948 domain-containing protein [Eggerthellaceae bacterium]
MKQLTQILDIATPILIAILIIVAIILVIALVRMVNKLGKTLDEVNKSIEPLVGNVNIILENAQPVVASVEPLIEHATLTVDAVNLEILRLDPVIEDLGDMTGSLTGAIDGISNAPSKLANSIYGKLGSINVPGKEKAAAVIANVKNKVASRSAAEDKAEVKTYTTVASDPEPASEDITKRAAHAKDESADDLKDALEVKISELGADIDAVDGLVEDELADIIEAAKAAEA